MADRDRPTPPADDLPPSDVLVGTLRRAEHAIGKHLTGTEVLIISTAIRDAADRIERLEAQVAALLAVPDSLPGTNPSQWAIVSAFRARMAAVAKGGGGHDVVQGG